MASFEEGSTEVTTVQEETVAEVVSTQEEIVTEVTTVQEKTVTEVVSTQEETVDEVVPVQDEIVAEVVPAQDEIVDEVVPIQDEIVAEVVPVQEDAADEVVVVQEEEEEEVEVEKESLSKKVWGIGVRHVVFMALGAALYAGLSYVTNTLQLPGASNVSLRPAIVIPLFFGAVFGPWVGFFTGFVGNSINDLLQGGFWWNWELGAGLIGLIAGLALYTTRGRYNNTLNIVFAEIFAVLGLLVGLAFSSITDIWVSGLSFLSAITTEFLPAFLPDLVLGVILLAILLVAYNAAIGRSGRS